jgi:hypothetical protein
MPSFLLNIDLIFTDKLKLSAIYWIILNLQDMISIASSADNIVTTGQVLDSLQYPFLIAKMCVWHDVPKLTFFSEMKIQVVVLWVISPRRLRHNGPLKPYPTSLRDVTTPSIIIYIYFVSNSFPFPLYISDYSMRQNIQHLARSRSTLLSDRKNYNEAF